MWVRRKPVTVYSFKDLNFTSPRVRLNNCTHQILEFEDINVQACLLSGEVFLRLCNRIELWPQCLLLSDLQFNIVCKRAPPYLTILKAITDNV